MIEKFFQFIRCWIDERLKAYQVRTLEKQRQNLAYALVCELFLFFSGQFIPTIRHLSDVRDLFWRQEFAQDATIFVVQCPKARYDLPIDDSSRQRLRTWINRILQTWYSNLIQQGQDNAMICQTYPCLSRGLRCVDVADDGFFVLLVFRVNRL